MAYTSNPYVGKARRLAVNDVLYGRCSITEAACKYGVTRSTIWRWMKKAPRDHRVLIQTLPSRPRHHPNQLKPEVVMRIIQLRRELKRCAVIIHAQLRREGVQVSLSSVKRTLKRHNLTRKKKQATCYTSLPRPLADAPGVLVQVDTIHFINPDKSRFYIYAVIDTYSRLAYAEYHPRLSQATSHSVIMQAQKRFGFPIMMIQTDNGPEFKDGLQASLGRQRIHLRHSRIRTPNDNAHVERFIRTIQEECFGGFLPNENTVAKKLKAYIVFYNTHRLHLSLNCLTPTEFMLQRS